MDDLQKHKKVTHDKDMAKKNKGSRGLVLMRKGMAKGTRKRRRQGKKKTSKKGRRCRNTRGKFKKC